jgi:hypothetical protein
MRLLLAATFPISVALARFLPHMPADGDGC